jgi:fibronectin-binding autotransporter adhesin
VHRSVIAFGRRTKLVALAVGAIPLTLCSTASGDRYWKNSVTADTWSAAADWSATSAAGPDDAGAPLPYDTAYIQNTTTSSYTITLDETSTIVSLQMGDTGGGIDTLSQPSAFNLSMGTERVAAVTNSIGAHIQSAGTNSYTGALIVGAGTSSIGSYSLGGTGSIDISGAGSGTLGMYVGYYGSGTLNQSGGTVTLDSASHGNLYLGDQSAGIGTYLLSGGSLDVAGGEYIGNPGYGNFDQSGGINTVGSLTTSIGSYVLSAGSLIVKGSETLNGMFNQTGGVHTANGNLTLTGGEYFLSGAASLSVAGSETYVLGYFGQSGASVHTVGGLTLGETGSGVYSLSGTASLTAGAETLGDGGPNNNATGMFTQSGGVNTTGNLSLGVSFGSHGTYNLNSGSLLASGESVGENGGVGTFQQSGGVSTTGGLSVGVGSAPGSSYLLSGTGSLNVTGPEYIGALGTGVFTQSGGVQTVSGNEYVGYGSFAVGSFNQSGGSTTITGSLMLGATANAGGNCLLSAGSLMAEDGIYIGGSSAAAGGTGTLAISGGSMSVTDGITVYSGSAYTQSGGSVSADLMTINSGATFAFNGGTLNIAAGTFNTSSPVAAGNGSTPTTLNLTGGSTGASYIFAQGLSISAAATLTGGGLITNSSAATTQLTVNGTLAPSASQNSISVNGSLTFEPSAITLIQRVGSTPVFASATSSGNMALAGVLAVYEDPENEAMTVAGQSFIILETTSAGVLGGAFSNIASGQTLTTTDGSASFLVTINEGLDGDVTLSDFQFVPEPGMVGVLGLGGIAMTRRKRKAAACEASPLSTL